jgi:hypothetical protein
VQEERRVRALTTTADREEGEKSLAYRMVEVDQQNGQNGAVDLEAAEALWALDRIGVELYR